MDNATNFLETGIDYSRSLPATLEPTKTNAYLLTFGVLLAIYLMQGYIKSNTAFKAPFVGYRSAWEPRLVVSLRFANGALSQVTEGYQKVPSALPL